MSVRVASRRHIPRGCRTEHVPGLTDKSKSLYEAYTLFIPPDWRRKKERDGRKSSRHHHDSQQPYSVEDHQKSVKWPYHIQPSMSSQCKTSCPPAPSQWQRHHAFQTKRYVLALTTEEDASMVYPFSEEEYTQHIENGYQKSMITGTAFVDLSAAYDTVNHILLIQKLFNTTQASAIWRIIQNLRSNRKLYVELDNERSRWRLRNSFQHIHQWSASPWGNKELHTRRRPMHHSPVPYLRTSRVLILTIRNSPRFIYGTEKQRSLKVSWNGVDLENTTHSKYLGVTLDRTLGYKHHIQNTKMKVASRNNLLKKLANSKLGTNASTIRTIALANAMCYSISEYATPVWASSTYADILDPELNKAYQAITGCPKGSKDNNLQAVELSGHQTCTLFSFHPFKPLLDGFPNQFAAAKLTHYSTMSHRPSDSLYYITLHTLLTTQTQHRAGSNRDIGKDEITRWPQRIYLEEAESFTSDQVTSAIKSCRNSRACSTDSLSIVHLKNLGPPDTEHLTSLYNDSLKYLRVPSIWKTSLVIPIPKPGKNSSQGTSYRPMSLLCPAAKGAHLTLYQRISLTS